MQYNKKISIITPMISNDVIYLDNYLKSMQEQMYSNIEVILLCEKTPKVEEILEQYKDLNVKLLEMPDTSSVGEARSVGVEVATGDYIYFLDIDDCILKHTLYCLVESASVKNDQIVIGKLKESSVRPQNNESYNIMLNRLIEFRNNKANDATVKQLRFRCNNVLFDSKLIKDNEIKFDVFLNLYNDMQFMVNAIDNSDGIAYDQDAICFKMKRSDTVRYPSMKNRNKEKENLEFPLAYINSVKLINNKMEVKPKLDRVFNSKYNKSIASLYGKNTDKNILHQWAEAYTYVDMKNISGKIKVVSKIKNIEIEKLKKLEFKSSKNIAKTRLAARTCKKIYKSNSSAKRKGIYRAICNKYKVRENYVLYESFLGKNMSDSPKYIYKYLSEKYPGKYKHVWVFNDIKDDLPDDIIQVKRFSFKHLYYLATCKFWVSNMRQPKWYIKKDEQIFLSCWHGTPLKKLVFDMDEVHSANKNYKQDFYDQSRAWDYLISANEYSTNVFKSAFLFDNPILELGYPRNDLLYHENKDEMAKALKEKLGIPLDKKIVLYAPTWRDDEYYKPGKYKFKLKLDLERLKKELGDEYFFVLRTHYFIADHLDVSGVEDFVYNASKYDDITELYLLADVLITDYSSVFFDYANLKRPIMFFTYDLDKYKDTLRGFYLDMETECPGPMLKTNDEIIDRLKNLDKLKSDYSKKMEEFYNRFCYLEDGKASDRIAEEIIVKNTNK